MKRKTYNNINVKKKQANKRKNTPAVHGGRFVAVFTSPNRTVYASGAVAPSASVRLGQSLRSFPRHTPAQFASPGLCYAKPLFGPAKHHIPPKRYVQYDQHQLIFSTYANVKGICSGILFSIHSL
jgi:hypothetical protein